MNLILGDCLAEMDKLIEQGITVDAIITDPPYGETGNKWDKHIDFAEWFSKAEQLISDSGAIVINASTLLASKLIPLAPHLYKYDWVWVKDNGTNAPNVNLQPFRTHELVLVFGKGRVTNGKRTPMTYNPQKTSGTPYKQMAGRMSENWKGGLKQVITDNLTGERHPTTVQKFTRDKGKHPTQKPVALIELMIKSYTNDGDTALDPFMGSGTTGVAAKNTNRKFIGIELDDKYFDIAKNRLEQSL